MSYGVCALYLSPLTNSHLCFQVKWAKENYHHNIGSPYSLRLASADATGKIIVWDVATGAARCEIQEHSKPIQGNDSAWCLYGSCFMEYCVQIHHLPFINSAQLWQGILLLGLAALCYVSLFILWVNVTFTVPQRNAVRFNSSWGCFPRSCDKKVEPIFMNVIDWNNNIYSVKYIFLLFSWSWGFLGHFSYFKTLWWCLCYTWWVFKILLYESSLMKINCLVFVVILFL